MRSDINKSSGENVNQLQVKVSYTIRLENGNLCEPFETLFTIQPQEISSLCRILLSQDNSSSNNWENEVIDVKGVRLKDDLPDLYNAVTEKLSEELSDKGISDQLYQFELHIPWNEFRDKWKAIEYAIAMFKLGRRVEQERKDKQIKTK